MATELEIKALSFLESFERLFSDDWDFTKDMLADSNMDQYIHPDGTFIDPKMDDESNNWANRGVFLDAYREFKKSATLAGYSHNELLTP